MSFFTQQKKTIVLDGKNSVTITKPSFGKRQAALAPASRVDAEAKQIVVVPALMQQELLCAWVTEWSGPGFDGMACTRENILQLDTDITDVILNEIDAFSSEVTEDTKK